MFNVIWAIHFSKNVCKPPQMWCQTYLPLLKIVDPPLTRNPTCFSHTVEKLIIKKFITRFSTAWKALPKWRGERGRGPGRTNTEFNFSKHTREKQFPPCKAHIYRFVFFQSSCTLPLDVLFFAPSDGKWVLKMKRGGFVPYGSIFTWGGGAGGNFSARTKSKPSLINTLCPEKLYNCTETIRFREVLLLLPGTIYNIHTAAGCFNKVKN